MCVSCVCGCMHAWMYMYVCAWVHVWVRVCVWFDFYELFSFHMRLGGVTWITTLLTTWDRQTAYQQHVCCINKGGKYKSGDVCLAYSKILVFSNSYMDIIWYLYPGHMYMYLHTSKLNIFITLSKSLNGFRKTTETSVKILFENRNTDC